MPDARKMRRLLFKPSADEATTKRERAMEWEEDLLRLKLNGKTIVNFRESILTTGKGLCNPSNDSETLQKYQNWPKLGTK